MNDVLRQVWVVRVPHQSNCDNLRSVHQHTANPNPLPTVALEYTHEASLTFPTGSTSSPRIPGSPLLPKPHHWLTHRTVPEIPHGAGILQQLTKHAWGGFFSSFQHTNSLIALRWGIKGWWWWELQINHSCKLLTHMFDFLPLPTILKPRVLTSLSVPQTQWVPLPVPKSKAHRIPIPPPTLPDRTKPRKKWGMEKENKGYFKIIVLSSYNIA